MDKQKLGLYIHIPFCSKKCDYCDFTSFYADEEVQVRYLIYLEKEIDIISKKTADKIFDSIYIGGGTPSFVYDGFIISLLHKIYAALSIEKGSEVTIEVNPASLTRQKLIEYHLSGVNRISMGVQTTDDSLLKSVGRIQSEKNVQDAFELFKKVNFNNLSVDLMIGLPNQTKSMLDKTLKFILKYPIKHISLYALQLESSTPLHDKVEAYNELSKIKTNANLKHASINSMEMTQDESVINQIKQGAIKPLSEEECVDLYNYAVEKLEKDGLYRYEVSNFSRTGFRSKHNLKYWNREEYIGLGLSAHSFYDGYRYGNTDRLDTYMAKLDKNQLPYESREYIDKEMQRTEYIMLALRTQLGLNLAEFKVRMNEDILISRKSIIDRLVSLNMLIIENGYMRVSRDQYYVANQIILELI